MLLFSFFLGTPTVMLFLSLTMRDLIEYKCTHSLCTYVVALVDVAKFLLGYAGLWPEVG